MRGAFFMPWGWTLQQFFQQLEDEQSFCDLVRPYFEAVPNEMHDIFECTITVDEEKLKQAHRKYVAAVQDLVLYVDSKMPDHFKRAGALLIALHKGIVEVEFGTVWEEVEAGGGPLDLHYNDVDSGKDFMNFFAKFHDQMLAFMFAFQCCDAYEEANHSYSFEYLRHICAYLRRNANDVDLETCFMIFKSLMDR